MNRMIECPECMGIGGHSTYEDGEFVNHLCDECEGEGNVYKPYTTFELSDLCMQHDLDVEYIPSESIMRMRYIMTLRNAGVLQ